MKHGIISKTDLSRWFDSLKSKGRIYGPTRKEGAFVYRLVSEFAEMSLLHVPTILPPKKYLFPQRELLFRFTTRPFTTTPAPPPTGESILFGVHTCDIAGSQCLDAVFRDAPSDPSYLARQERTTIVGVECMDYCDSHASCAAVGTHVHKGGYDVMLTDIGEAYVIYVKTEKGEGLVKGRKYVRALRSTDEEQLARARERKAGNFHREFQGTMAEVDEAFDRGFHSPVWTDVGRRCVGCTNCTAVCPTCFCFDPLKDTVALNLADGQRQRYWERMRCSPGFAEVSGGENFRRERSDRLRHRVFRKGKLIRESLDRPRLRRLRPLRPRVHPRRSPIGRHGTNQMKGGVRDGPERLVERGESGSPPRSRARFTRPRSPRSWRLEG